MSDERFRMLSSVIRQRSAEVPQFLSLYLRGEDRSLPCESSHYLDEAKRSAQLAFSAALCISQAVNS